MNRKGRHMSSEQVDKDYKDFQTCIEQLAEEELERIRKKTSKIKDEARKIGAELEASLVEEAGKKKG